MRLLVRVQSGEIFSSLFESLFKSESESEKIQCIEFLQD